MRRTTLWRRIKDCDFHAESNFVMSNEKLDDLIKSIKNEHPLSGKRIIIGILRAKGVSVQRWKIREYTSCRSIQCSNSMDSKTSKKDIPCTSPQFIMT